jgi:Sec-independent protein translocase protein TatA
MFEGRFPELLIIFVVALVVLGPHKLPQVAATDSVTPDPASHERGA